MKYMGWSLPWWKAGAPRQLASPPSKLPNAWQNAKLRASYVQPETDQTTALKADEFVIDRKTGTALLKTPAFPTYLIVYVQALEKGNTRCSKP